MDREIVLAKSRIKLLLANVDFECCKSLHGWKVETKCASTPIIAHQVTHMALDMPELVQSLEIVNKHT